ncbi:MAG: acyl carrier protein [Desulfovibrionaceae bacterium]
MKDKLYPILSAVLEIEPGALHEGLTAEEVGAWDSIRHLNLVLTLEQEFGVAFSDDDIFNMLSVKGIMDCLESRQQS